MCGNLQHFVYAKLEYKIFAAKNFLALKEKTNENLLKI